MNFKDKLIEKYLENVDVEQIKKDFNEGVENGLSDYESVWDLVCDCGIEEVTEGLRERFINEYIVPILQNIENSIVFQNWLDDNF